MDICITRLGDETLLRPDDHDYIDMIQIKDITHITLN